VELDDGHYHVVADESGLPSRGRSWCLAGLAEVRAWLEISIEYLADESVDDGPFNACLDRLAGLTDGELVGGHRAGGYLFRVHAVESCAS
jgi:hypothetical protein